MGDVANAWRSDPAEHEKVFNQIGGIADQARLAIENGKIVLLGPLMNQNHQLLARLDVSSPQLDRLVAGAVEAGAWGAKLSGGGRGGNMIAVVDPQLAQKVSTALLDAGAVKTIITQVNPPSS